MGVRLRGKTGDNIKPPKLRSAITCRANSCWRFGALAVLQLQFFASGRSPQVDGSIRPGLGFAAGFLFVVMQAHPLLDVQPGAGVRGKE